MVIEITRVVHDADLAREGHVEQYVAISDEQVERVSLAERDQRLAEFIRLVKDTTRRRHKSGCRAKNRKRAERRQIKAAAAQWVSDFNKRASRAALSGTEAEAAMALNRSVMNER